MKKHLQQGLLYLSIIILAVFYGIYAERSQNFFALMAEEVFSMRVTLFSDPPYIKPYRGQKAAPTRADRMMPGLTMLVHFIKGDHMAVSVIDADKKLIHRWNIDWFDIWPDAEHIPYFRKPKSEPGTMIHGAKILDNGDLVFNFEYLGMVRLDACGNVRWRLAEQSHHSIDIDEDGNIWAPVNHHRQIENSTMPMHYPFYVDPYIYKISPDGKVITKKSILSILAENNLYGAMFLSSLNNTDPVVKGDTLHVNDIEVFPSTMKPGLAQPGDILVSMRNISSIMIVEPGTWRVKHLVTGVSLRQHDPDFIDGNTIAIYDNNNRFAVDDPEAFSRIITVTLPDHHVTTIFRGTTDKPFFSKILGKEQWLANGNILFSDAEHGQAVEITREGAIVWQYINRISEHKVGTIQEATRLPLKMNADFFKQHRSACQ